MAAGLETEEIISSLLLVKAVLALLCLFVYAYYKMHWNRAKRHLAVHFLYTKWRAVKHTGVLGLAAFGFASGFTLELFGVQLGLSPNMARALSSLLEIVSLFAMLFVFFKLALEDVPHFQHIAETVRHHHHREEPKRGGKR